MGTELRNARQKTGMTLSKAAEALGWGLSTLSELETGKRPATIAQLQRAAEVYEAPELIQTYCEACPLHPLTCGPLRQATGTEG